MLTIATLGPAGSNHEFVATRWAGCIGLPAFRLELVEVFDDAVARARRGDADCIVQCAAHPDVARTIGENLEFLRVVDTFIAAGKPLAILTRRDAETPRTIAFHPATRSYADLARWPHPVEEQSTVRVAEGLLDGRYDSGLTLLEVAQAHPDLLRVEQRIDAPQDAWLVHAPAPRCEGGISAWRDGPGATWLRRRAAGG